MKTTYKKTIEKSRLVIRYDETAYSPREWSNLGYFVTIEDRYMSPDDNETLKNIIESTQYEVKNAEEHAEAIQKKYEKETGEKVLAVYPVYRYEHGAVAYRRGTASGFDVGNCGFYVVTEKTAEELGTPSKYFERVIDGELETYTKYVNGDMYMFTLYDENGEVEEACGGFYNIEDIKEHLTEEWQKEDLEEYLEY